MIVIGSTYRWKVNCPVAVRRYMLGTEAENGGIGLRIKFMRRAIVLESLNILKVLIIVPRFQTESRISIEPTTSYPEDPRNHVVQSYSPISRLYP